MSPAAELSAILLAAGGSSRLGQAKQLLSIGGLPLVRRQAMRLCGISRDVVTVVGHDAEAVRAALEGLPVNIIENEHWRQGMGGSLALGAGGVNKRSDAVLVLLCDQYRITGEDLARLVDAWRQQPEAIVASRWGAGEGPPAVFPRSHFEALRALAGERGARFLLRSAESAVRHVDMAHAAYDLDTPADLDALRRYGDA